MECSCKSVWPHLCRYTEIFNFSNFIFKGVLNQEKNEEDGGINRSWSLFSPVVHIFISGCIRLQWSGQLIHLLLVLSAASWSECGNVRIWKTPLWKHFLIRVVGLGIVRVGLVLECGRAEILRENKGRALFWFCLLCFLVFWWVIP